MQRTAVVIPPLALLCRLAQSARGIVAPSTKTVEKGLAWVARPTRRRPLGCNGGLSVTMTALGGMALMEGGTIRDGKYSEKIRQTIADGADAARGRSAARITRRRPGDTCTGTASRALPAAGVRRGRDGDRRKKLERILTQAVGSREGTTEGRLGLRLRG